MILFVTYYISDFNLFLLVEVFSLVTIQTKNKMNDNTSKSILLNLLDQNQATKQQKLNEVTLIFWLPSRPFTGRNNDKTLSLSKVLMKNLLNKHNTLSNLSYKNCLLNKTNFAKPMVNLAECLKKLIYQIFHDSCSSLELSALNLKLFYFQSLFR